jgi:hypothetical protein
MQYDVLRMQRALIEFHYLHMIGVILATTNNNVPLTTITFSVNYKKIGYTSSEDPQGREIDYALIMEKSSCTRA